MAALAELVAFAVRLLGIWLVVRFVAQGLRRLGGARPPSAAGPDGGAVVQDLVRDRVCNTFLPREHALSAVVQGREEHFCSPACRDRALASASRAS